MVDIPPFPQDPVQPPERSMNGCATYFPAAVRIAISNWQKLFVARRNSYEELDRRINEPDSDITALPPTEEQKAHLARSHPESDDGRKEVLLELHNRYYVSFNDWQIDEVELFARLAYPLKLLVKTTTDGKPSSFLRALHDLWQPSLRDWAEFLWLFSHRAREFFADLVYLQRDSIFLKSYEKTGTVLFHDLIEDGLYTKNTCPSIVGALLPYPMECYFARKHACEMRRLAAHLGPDTLGLVVRSLIIHRAHQPRNPRDCGYRPNESHCVCPDNMPNTCLPRGLESDIEKEYACVLLSLLIGREGENQGLKYDGKWNIHDIDALVVESCEHIFTEGTYIAIYASLHSGNKPLRKLMYPRRRTDTEFNDGDYRRTFNDFENALFQTGACVVPACKQIMRTGCENAACASHCKDGYVTCRAHRQYNVNVRPALPERRCIVDITIGKEEKRMELVPRDRENI